MTKREVRISLTYELDAAPMKVWRALTVPEYVSRWLGNPVDLDSDCGPQENFELKLISAEPDTRVRYSIKDDEAVSTVTFQIDANGSGGTTFRIIHEQSMITANCNMPVYRQAA